ncbi:MAG: sialate O-acetylesterase [Paludibacter sp.]|nr:sialate O-acetylesterase [Paludibacter sp.]
MKIIILTCVLIISYTTTSSQLKFAECFTEQMVLQRDMPVKVWGNAEKNETVQVEIQQNVYKTKADKAGFWSITTNNLKTGGPYKLSLKGKISNYEIQEVYVGEVWIAGGQSNMEMELSRSTDGKKHIESATNDQIRFIHIPRPDKVKTPEDNLLKWKPATTENVGVMSAVAYHFAKTMQPEINVPIGIICCYRGGSSAESWISIDDLNAHPQLKSIIEFKPADRAEGSNQRRRNTLYEDMLARVIPFTARGVIWYQGEANASRAEQYKTLFPYLIQSWRQYFEQPDMPFYFVQLPKFGVKGANNTSWAELREAQLETLINIKNTGMAVTLDCGEETQLHPKNKKPVGERLAYIALNKNYAKDITFSGPLFKEMKINGNQVVVAFEHVGKGLTTKNNDEIKGFEISGDGKSFVKGNARIEKDKVIVQSDEIKKPVAIRYGWSNCPDANLYNIDGLMASPFRTQL